MKAIPPPYTPWSCGSVSCAVPHACPTPVPWPRWGSAPCLPQHAHHNPAARQEWGWGWPGDPPRPNRGQCYASHKHAEQPQALGKCFKLLLFWAHFNLAQLLKAQEKLCVGWTLQDKLASANKRNNEMHTEVALYSFPSHIQCDIGKRKKPKLILAFCTQGL